MITKPIICGDCIAKLPRKPLEGLLGFIYLSQLCETCNKPYESNKGFNLVSKRYRNRAMTYFFPRK